MKFIKYLFFFSLIISCSNEKLQLNVGDSYFQSEVDNKDFKICNENKILQYYVRYSFDEAPRYEGEKRALDNFIMNNYKHAVASDQNGYLTIRFIVNCEGNTGRFRTEEMDKNYEIFSFEKSISVQLLEIVKQLDGWIPRRSRNKDRDYYQYLTFKIENGQIVKILP